MNKTQKVWLTIGAPASGKSTWARETAKVQGNTVITERDTIRTTQGLKPGQDEKLVTKVQRGQIDSALLDGFNVIVADTNLNKTFRKELIRYVHKLGYDVELVLFEVPLDTLIWHDSHRGLDSVGNDVVVRFFNQFEQQLKAGDFKQTEFPVQSFVPYAHAGNRPKAVVIDFDGTVARGDGHRSPYDYDKVSDDEPIQDIIDMANALSREFTIIGVSGRKSSCYWDTWNWAKKNNLILDALYMRAADDERADWIIKNEIYDQYIIPVYDVVGVLDDRDQVVTHLRRRGLTVLQVNYGRF